MKKIYKFIFVLLPLSVLFSSCLDISRNIKLNTDGSGKEVMTINLAHSFFQMMTDLSALDTTKKKPQFDDAEIISQMKENLAKNSNISVNDINAKWNSDSSKTFTIDFNFTDVSAVALAFDDGDISGSQKQSSATMKEQDGKILFNYTLLSEMDQQDSSSAKLSQVMFKDKKYTMTIEFPYEVITSNAQITDGRKLTWELPMDGLSKNPTIEFTAELKK